MAYILKKHCNIAGYADTARNAAAGPDSTNLPDGWIDHEGKYWETNFGSIATEIADNSIWTNAQDFSNLLYRPSGENFQDGKVVVRNFGQSGIYGNYLFGGIGFRFSTGGGGDSGYVITIVNPSVALIALYAVVDGVKTAVPPGLFGDASIDNDPFWIDVVFSTSSGTTTIVCNIYADAHAPDANGDFGGATPYVTRTWTDSTPELQVSGATGVVAFSATYYKNFDSYVPEPGVHVGTPNTTAGYGKTRASLTWASGSGGTGPYTYDLKRAPDVSGSPGSFTPIATSLSTTTFHDTTLSAGSTYYYKVLATDSLSAVGTSGTFTLLTRAANVLILGIVGDSNYDNGVTPNDIADDLAIMTGLPCIAISNAVGGTGVDLYLSGALYDTGIAMFTNNEVTVINWMLMTNDCAGGNSHSGFLSSVQQIPAAYFDFIPSLQSIVFNMSGAPDLAKASIVPDLYTWAANQADVDARLEDYWSSYNSIANGTSIFAGDRRFFNWTAADTNARTDSTGQHYHDVVVSGDFVAYNLEAIDHASGVYTQIYLQPTAQSGNNNVTLHWVPPVDAASSNVYRGTSPGTATLLTSGITATSYVDSTAVNGTTYYYQISTTNENTAVGEASPSRELGPMIPNSSSVHSRMRLGVLI